MDDPTKFSPAWPVALHEAAHCVCGDVFGFAALELRASRRQGRCLLKPPAFCSPVQEIALIAAGSIGERRAHFGARWSNVEHSRGLPIRPVAERRPRKFPPLLMPGQSDAARLNRFRAGGTAEASGTDMYMSRLGHWLACRILHYREGALAALAEELYRVGYMPGGEAEAILVRHPGGWIEAERVTRAAVRLSLRHLKTSHERASNHESSR